MGTIISAAVSGLATALLNFCARLFGANEAQKTENATEDALAQVAKTEAENVTPQDAADAAKRGGF